MDLKEKQNFISVDGKTVRNSYGDFFSVGDIVRHDDASAGTAKIISFEPIKERNEIRVHTDKGYAHIDFIFKP
jgi:thioredoxin reductase